MFKIIRKRKYRTGEAVDFKVGDQVAFRYEKSIARGDDTPRKGEVVEVWHNGITLYVGDKDTPYKSFNLHKMYNVKVG